jgi:hypothetical protein
VAEGKRRKIIVLFKIIIIVISCVMEHMSLINLMVVYDGPPVRDLLAPSL